VNLAEGNGYTESLSAPHVPNFTRDPAYPFFMSIVYRVYNTFHELTIIPYNNIKLNNSGRLLFVPGEMLWVRLTQMLLASLSCIFFYLILKNIFKPQYALLLILLFAIYFPYTYNDQYILRESFQSSVTILANYFFISFLKKNRIIYIIYFGVLWGILNLTIQTSLIIGFFFPVILLISTRNFKKTLKATLIAVFSMLVIVSPYLYRAYKFYPDIRVTRSMGCSITLEKSNYYGTLIKLKNLDYISQQQFDSLANDLWSLSEYKTFEKSFNGEFNRLTNGLKTQYPINNSIEIKYNIKNWTSLASKTWFKNIYKNPKSSFLNSLRSLNLISLVPNFISIIFGLLAIVGFLIYFKNTYKILLIFFSTISIFYIIGDEARRSLPAHPYIFMFGILSILTIYFNMKKSSMKNINERLFI